jgi:hypothetical protein
MSSSNRDQRLGTRVLRLGQMRLHLISKWSLAVYCCNVLDLVNNNPWGTLPRMWAFGPSVCHHDQICSNQAHLSIIQGSKDVRANVWRWWVTKLTAFASHVPKSCNKGTMSWLQAQDVPQRTMLGPSKTKQSMRQGKSMFRRNISP